MAQSCRGAQLHNMRNRHTITPWKWREQHKKKRGKNTPTVSVLLAFSWGSGFYFNMLIHDHFYAVWTEGYRMHTFMPFASEDDYNNDNRSMRKFYDIANQTFLFTMHRHTHTHTDNFIINSSSSSNNKNIVECISILCSVEKSAEKECNTNLAECDTLLSR